MAAPQTERIARPRSSGIGGSEAAAAVGLDPYCSRVELWLRKTGRVPEPDESEAMYWGTTLEPLVRDAAQKALEDFNVMGPPPRPVTSEAHPFMVGHLDGTVAPLMIPVDALPLTWESAAGAGIGVFEAKTTSGFSRDWDDDGTPSRYVIQVQHYMALTGLSFAVIACLIGGQRFVTRRIDRDDELIAKLLEAEAAFWLHVEQDEPPEPDGSESAEKMLRLLYPEGKGAVIATAEDAALVRDYRKLKRAAEAAERQADEAEQRIKARIGDHEVLVWHGRPLVKWTRFEQRRFDQSGFREAEPVLWEQWKRDVQSQRFIVSRERGD